MFIDIGGGIKYYTGMRPISTKQCIKCLRVLPISDFLPTSWYKKDRTLVRGIDGQCKSCDYANQREHYKTPKGRYSCYKRNAKKRGIPFKLTFEEFMTLWNRDCEYCGTPINGIGIDRLDSNGIYEINNVAPCCTPCNIFKSRLGKEGYIEMCIRVAEHQKNK